MKQFVMLSFVIIASLVFNLAHAQKSVVMVIKGNVKDSVSNNPIAGAKLSALNVDVFPVQTDQNGDFRFIVMASSPVEIKVSKSGYSPFEKLLKPQERVELNVRLVPMEMEEIRITMTHFQRNSHIWGQIEGLSPEHYGEYKILVYVLTNKWYIHPWADSREGRGFASIRSDGTWKIGTIWRGYQAYRVAFLLCAKSSYSPPTVEVISDDPEQDLLSKINVVAYSIIEAPRGI